MTDLHVTYSGHLTDRVQDLYYGKVKPEGINLHFIPETPEGAFHRMTFNNEFEASEMSFSTYIARVARNECPFIAIPVFPSRVFRHSAIYLNRHSGIQVPQDLAGRRVGVVEYQMTAALWVRGFLQHDYGVKSEDIREWVTGGLHNPGRKQMISTDIPNVNIRREDDKALDDMLVNSEIDALITARAPRSFLDGNPNIVRLFPNYDEVEREYYSKRKLFPIMHTVILRKDFYDQYPWAAISLYNAFVESKENSIRRIVNHDLVALPISLPWIPREIEKTQELMQNNFWAYGLEDCWNEIDAMCQYSYEQGLSPRRVDPKELFAPNVINMSNTTRI